MTKLANAKDWRNRDVEDWTNVSFTEYMKAKHKDLFGIEYAPFGGTWGLEQRIIGDLIGTQSRKNPKQRTASNEMVKLFIDRTFETYRPTQKYPGTSLGFMWTYNKQEWQRIQSEEAANKRAEEAEAGAPDLGDLNDWF